MAILTVAIGDTVAFFAVTSVTNFVAGTVAFVRAILASMVDADFASRALVVVNTVASFADPLRADFAVCTIACVSAIHTHHPLANLAARTASSIAALSGGTGPTDT